MEITVGFQTSPNKGVSIQMVWSIYSLSRPFFSPNSVSTLWGSYGSGKEWCPSAAPRFDCAGSHRVPFVTTVCGRSGGAGFWVVLPGVRALFEAKRGFT